jgi:hypothetical protein
LEGLDGARDGVADERDDDEPRVAPLPVSSPPELG